MGPNTSGPRFQQASNRRKSSLVDKLLNQDFEISPKLSRNSASSKAYVTIDGEQTISVLPIHIACLSEDLPITLLEQLIQLMPSSLLKESKPKRQPKLMSLAIRSGRSFDDSSSSSLDKSTTGKPTSQSSPEQDFTGWLPIHVAACFGSAQMLHLLAQKQPNSLRYKTRQGMLPIHVACLANKIDNIRVLVEAFPKSTQIVTSLGLSCSELVKQPVPSEVKDILETSETKEGASMFAESGPMCHHIAMLPKIATAAISSFLDAMDKKDWDTAAQLLQKHPLLARQWSLRSNDISHLLPLHRAIQLHAPTSMLEQLVEAFPESVDSCEYHGRSVLHTAAISKHTEAILCLTSNRRSIARSVDLNGQTPLHLATPTGDEHLVRTLLNWNSDSLECEDNNKSTPRSLAVGKAKELCDRGMEFWGAKPVKLGSLADHVIGHDALSIKDRLERFPEEKDEWRLLGNGVRALPIHIACITKAPVEVVELLTSDFGLQQPCYDEHDMLPLHLALQFGSSPAVVDMLVRLQPSAAARPDRMGLLPIHLACSDSLPPAHIVKRLLDAHPDSKWETDHKGRTPCFYAEAAQHPNARHIVQLLSAC